MGYVTPSSSFSESDLNGLADGHLEAGRQADLLQRLKSHGVERARVAAWREQNDLLRASFSGIENEPIPLALCLTPPPRLKCVANTGWSDAKPPIVAAKSVAAASSTWTRKRIVAFSAVVGSVIAFAWWLIAAHAMSIDPPALVLSATGRADGLLVTPSFGTPQSLETEETGTGRGKPVRPVRALPTTTIPDLGESGFSFTGASVRGNDPVAVVFSYESATGDHLVLSVSKPSTTRHDAAQTASAGASVAWQRHGTAFALGGIQDRPRLDAIATLLQAEEDASDPPD